MDKGLSWKPAKRVSMGWWRLRQNAKRLLSFGQRLTPLRPLARNDINSPLREDHYFFGRGRGWGEQYQSGKGHFLLHESRV